MNNTTWIPVSEREPKKQEKRIVILTNKQIEREADPNRVYISVPNDEPFSKYMNTARRMAPDEIHVDSDLAATVPDYERFRVENERFGIPTMLLGWIIS